MKITNNMPRLCREQRERAIGMSQMGATHAHIARTMNCTRITITRLMQRYRQTGVTTDRPRSGRPHVTTPNEDRYLRMLHLRNRFLTVTSSAASGLRHAVSALTVTRRLRQSGVRAYRPFRGVTLTRDHRRRRLQWARQFQGWRQRDWQRILFTDESRFQIFRADGRVRVYRRRGERSAECCVQETVPFGGGSVMVWAGICGQERTDLVVIDQNLNAQRYIDQVLRPVALPFLQRHRRILLQQDNARPHTARVTQQFLAINNVNVLPWPARSPDMSPIEHLWDALDRQIRDRPHPPANRQALVQALHEEWQRIPNNRILHLTNSVVRRVQACIAARGGHTPY